MCCVLPMDEGRLQRNSGYCMTDHESCYPPLPSLTAKRKTALGFWFTRSNHINLTCQGAVFWCGTHLPATEHMFNGSKGWLLLLQGKNQLLCLPVLQDDGIPFGEGLWGFIECHFSVDLKQAKYMKGKSHEIKHWTQRTSRESEANVSQPKKESVC